MSGNDDGAVIEAAETAESVENEEAAETAAESSGNKGHGRRLKRAELKELVLQAGFEVLVEEGLGIGIDHITYGKVFDQLEKTHGIRTSRGSVHERIWDSQRDFQLEVAQRALAYRPTLSYSQAIEVALETLEAGDMTTPGSRHRTRLDTVRKGGQASIDGLVNDWTQRIFLGVLGAAATQRAVPSETTSNLQNEVTKSYDAIQETFLGLYRGVADTLQLRPRSDLFGTDHERAYDILTYLGTALAEGMSVRLLGGVNEGEVYLPTGANSQNQEWDLFSLGLILIVIGLFESIHDEDDLSLLESSILQEDAD